MAGSDAVDSADSAPGSTSAPTPTTTSTPRTWAGRFKKWLKTPSPAHVLVIAVLGSAGGGLALPQEIPIIREFACDWYYKRNPALIAAPAPAPAAAAAAAFHLLAEAAAGEERCQIPQVSKLAGEVVTVARMFNAVITVFCLTLYSDLLSRYGRKPMFAFTAFCLTCSILLFGLGAYFRGSLGITLIAINFLFSGIGSQPLLQLTFQSYIVDCVKTEERSPTFALLGSATFGGLAVSSVVSSLMTTYTDIPLLPFWVGTGIFFLMLMYSLFVLPEALTPERRKVLMEANEATQETSSPGDHEHGQGEEDHEDEDGSEEDDGGSDDEYHFGDSALGRFFKRINFLKKLAILLPRKKEGEEGRDYRLLILAIAFAVYRIGGLYTNDLLLLTTTGSFGFTGAENGMLVGFITAAKAILLMGILPFVIRLGRNKYSKWALHKSSVQPAMEGLSESSRLLADRERQEEEEEDAQVQGRTANAPATDYGTSSKQNGAASTRKGKEEEENPDGTERFDLYFGALSFTIDALALVGVGLSKVTWHLYASTALLAISSAGGPSLQAVITEITSKALTDQVMATTGLIENICAVLSPLILGGIYSTAGRVAWFVSASLFILAALIMLCTPSKPTYMGHKSRRTRRRKRATPAA